MIPIDRIIKNQDLSDKKLDYENMDVSELEYHYNRYKKLKDNSKLLNTLKDKGAKVKNQFETIQRLLVKKCKEKNLHCEKPNIELNIDENNFENLLLEFKSMNIVNANKTKTEKILEHIDDLEKENCIKKLNYKVDLDIRFQKLIDKIDDENARKELLDDLNSAENINKINEKSHQENLNYFPQNLNDENKKILSKKDLNDVKKKLIEKYRRKDEGNKAQTISLKESLILVEEQTKRYQELQIQQAAQKLLQGSQFNNFDYSNVDSVIDKTRYRVKTVNEVEEFNESYSDDNSDDTDSDYENFTNNYESYNEKKLSQFKKNVLNSKKTEPNSSDENEFDKVD